uniref:GPI transamidase component PIG-S n=1 Tax=Mesocestoides corti TaxID=53468 RepID=A0A5K3FAP9_MESCO
MDGTNELPDVKTKDVIEKEELARMQPTFEERRWFHCISLFFLLVALVIGLPLWWLTTSPEQYSIPTEKIRATLKRPITVAVDVGVIILDPRLSIEDAESLKQYLYSQAADAQRNLDSQHSHHMGGETSDSANLPVRVDYKFHISRPAFDIFEYFSLGVSTDLDSKLPLPGLFDGHNSSNKKQDVDDSYYFAILPNDFPGFKSVTGEPLRAIVRNSPTKNLIYVRSPCISKSSRESCPSSSVSGLSSTIFPLLQEHLVVPSRLQAIYSTVWWAGSDMHQLNSRPDHLNHSDYNSALAELARIRTHQLPTGPGYEVTISLVSAFDSGPGLPLTDDWLWTANSQGLSLGDWVRISVEPGLVDLKRFINLNVYSQYLYSVTLDGILWSRISKDRSHRYYTATQLSGVLNSLEAYLGQHSSQRGTPDRKINGGKTAGTNGGLHFVIVVDNPEREFNVSTRRPLRFHLSTDGVPTSVAVVPQWGAFISLDDVDVNLTNLGTVLVNAIRSFIGISVRRNALITLTGGGEAVLLEQGSTKGKIVKRELDSWLRFRTIESLSTVSLILTSLVNMVEHVPTTVINPYVAGRVKHGVAAWVEAVSELASHHSTNACANAFVSARIAHEDADAAFFDHSLLDLLYFPVRLIVLSSR